MPTGADATMALGATASSGVSAGALGEGPSGSLIDTVSSADQNGSARDLLLGRLEFSVIAVRPATAGPGAAILADDGPLAQGLRMTSVVAVHEVQTLTVQLPFQSRQVNDPDLDAGATAVESEGSVGFKDIYTEVGWLDGVKVNEAVIGEEVTIRSRDRVVHVGTRPLPLPQDGTYRFLKSFTTHDATSYCLTGSTATGTQAGPGAIAVDPSTVRLGSHLYVSGYGFGYAVDTGGDIIGDHVDLWKTCDDAIAWGRRTATVYVLDH